MYPTIHSPAMDNSQYKVESLIVAYQLLVLIQTC